MDLDVPDPEDGHSACVWLEFPARGVLPLQGVEPRARLEPGESGRLAARASAIEGAERTVQPLEGPSADRDAIVQDLGAHLAQLGQGPALLDVVDGPAFPGPRAPAVLQGGVVELTLQPERHLEPLGLLLGRVEPIAKGPTQAHRWQRSRRV